MHASLRHGLLALAALLAWSDADADATARWMPLGPPRLHGHAGDVDRGPQRLVVFGGASPSGDESIQRRTYSARVLALDLVGDSSWTDITPASGGPGARQYHTAIADPVGDRLVVFGGRDASGLVLPDTWALSLSGTPAWERIHDGTGVAPGPRAQHSAVYDSATRRMLVYGGTNDSDVWALALDGPAQWTPIVPASGPRNRLGHAAILDPVRHRMLIHGGTLYDSPYPQRDIWALDLGDTVRWVRVLTTGELPPAQVGYSAIYDPGEDRMLVTGTPPSPGGPAVVWELPLSGTPVWANIGIYGISGSYPPDRYDAVVAFDAHRGRMLLHGGTRGSSQPMGDISALVLSPPMRWDPIGPNPGPAATDRSVLEPSSDEIIAVDPTQVWSLRLGEHPAWRRWEITGPGPVIRSGFGCALDPVGRRVIAWGGWGGENDYPTSTWSLSAAGAPGWPQVPVTGGPPPGRWKPGFVYDSRRHRFLLFGGRRPSQPLYDDVWELQLTPSGGTWSVVPVQGWLPMPRMDPVMCYDATGDRILVWGGLSGGGSVSLDDCWELSFATNPPTWTQLNPAGTGPLPGVHPGGLDLQRQRLLIAHDDELYELPIAGPMLWTRHRPLNEGGVRGVLAYDAVRDQLIGSTGYGFAAIVFGEPVASGPECVGPSTWSAGGTVRVPVPVRNGYSMTQSADWELTSERAWAGYPLWGTLAIAPGEEPMTLTLDCPVPDSAAAGLNTMTLRVRLRETGRSGTCTFHLHDITTPTQASLVVAGATVDRVHLRWFSEQILSARLERREPASGWSLLATLTPDGEGYLEWFDRNVTPGARYGYRLLAGGWTSAETWVDVPAGRALSLAPAGAHPAQGALWARMQLPAAGRARIEVLDVSGRRVRSRDVWADAAGARTERVDGGRALEPGVYLLRLAFAGRTATARAVVVR